MTSNLEKRISSKKIYNLLTGTDRPIYQFDSTLLDYIVTLRTITIHSMRVRLINDKKNSSTRLYSAHFSKQNGERTTRRTKAIRQQTTATLITVPLISAAFSSTKLLVINTRGQRPSSKNTIATHTRSPLRLIRSLASLERAHTVTLYIR